jgi:Ser/Thr protein kinase RdoA (MazF antagonist)
MRSREITRLIDRWDVGNLISRRRAEKGVVNVNWIVKTTKGKYVLRKVTHVKDVDDLNFELDYLTYLKEHGFAYSVPSPVKTKENMNSVKFNGSHFWLYRWIDGRIVKRFSHSELKECARMMASYHAIIESSGLNNKRGVGHVFNRNPILKELNTFMSRVSKGHSKDRKDKIFVKEATILIPLLESLDGGAYSKLPMYPLHRDINPENILWKRRRLVGVIDWENVSSMNDTIIKDISGMLQYSCRDKKYKHKLDLSLTKFFLKEYRKHHDLSDEEIRLIPDTITAGAIEDFSYAYWMLLNDPKRARLYRLRLYSNVAQWHNKNRDKMSEQLIDP